MAHDGRGRDGGRDAPGARGTESEKEGWRTYRETQHFLRMTEYNSIVMRVAANTLERDGHHELANCIRFILMVDLYETEAEGKWPPESIVRDKVNYIKSLGMGAWVDELLNRILEAAHSAGQSKPQLDPLAKDRPSFVELHHATLLDL